ncbi:AAA family ATPase [Parabacteroides chinchillae]
MKILAIRGRNLASLEGEFSIDFTVEPLLSAGIFAISGPTGAGKSTLLDAMCLALFSRTPRTDQAKENNVRLRDVNEDVLPQGDPRFILRRGTAFGYAEVDFVALNGFRYRARWSVARARDKESGRLQNPKTTLFNLDKETEEQGTRSDLQIRIIELIGLTFEQFTRSVLLAQNDFSTFLKAEQGEKASLLEKLTGTEQFSAISRLIFTKNAEAREAYEKIWIQMQSVEMLAEEEVQAFEKRLSEVEPLLLRLESAKVERQHLQDAVKSAEQQIAGKQIQQKDISDKLARSIELLEKSRKDYEIALEKQQKAEFLYKSLQPELQQARKLDVQIETVLRSFSEAEQRLKEAAQSKKEAENKLFDLQKKERQGQEEIEKLKAWREKYKGKAGIAEQLPALLLHLDAAFSARQSFEKSAQSILVFKQQIGRLDIELTTLAASMGQHRSDLLKVETELNQIDILLKQIDTTSLDKSIAEARSERERLLVEQAQFVTTGDIKALRDKLSDGTPCPVCGSKEHPYASHETGEKLLALAKGISDITIQIQQLVKQSETYTANQKRQALLQQRQLQLHKQITESENVRIGILNQQKLVNTQISHEEALSVEHQEVQIRSLLAANQVFGSDSWQNAWQQNPEAFRKTLTDFSRQWRNNEECLQQLERQQGILKAECESHSTFLPKQIAQWKEFEMIFQKHRDDLKNHRDDRNRLLSGRSADEVEQEYVCNMEELKENLKKLQSMQVEQSGIVEQYKGVTEQITKDLADTSVMLSEKKAALEVWINQYNELSGGISLEDALTQASKEKAECTFRLRTHAENLQKVAGLKDELDKRSVISERWAKLNDLAGSSDGAKFRRIAQGYTLDVLLNYANVQLRGLTKRYRLERVPDTLALQVIDQDMCDEVRSVHSLSGGESFLVSLALALGLSSLSSNRMKVESLFIDEGFGSLDSETLRVAMDALESLHTQGRKIGVISHVQEMTERIPTQIRVQRSGNGRSSLKIM